MADAVASSIGKNVQSRDICRHMKRCRHRHRRQRRRRRQELNKGHRSAAANGAKNPTALCAAKDRWRKMRACATWALDLPTHIRKLFFGKCWALKINSFSSHNFIPKSLF